MTVYIVTESHRAEGMNILGVFMRHPSQVEVDPLPSGYDAEERAKWCERRVEAYEVKP